MDGKIFLILRNKKLNTQFPYITNHKTLTYIDVKIKQKAGISPAFLLAKISAKTYETLLFCTFEVKPLLNNRDFLICS